MLELSPGGVIGTLLFAWCTLMALTPLRRPWSLGLLSWASSFAFCEVPLLLAAIVVASTGPAAAQGVRGVGGWVVLAISAATVAGLVVVARRAGRAAPVLEAALDEALGDEWRTARWRHGLPRRPWWRPPVPPWPVRPRGVERVRDLAYAPGGAATTLDLYRRRGTHGPAPTFVHLHGGHFRWGRKSREARALLHHLARSGWIGISANYHLSRTPAAGFPQPVIDVKRLLAWLRDDGAGHGVDPDAVVLSGSSAGAHLTGMAATTVGHPAFQPGFEGEDTSFAGAVGFYGYYGDAGSDPALPSSPLRHDARTAPPCFLVHGEQDTYTAVEGATALRDHLRATARRPVAFAALPGAQHSFDVFDSVRYRAVVEAVSAFATWAVGPGRRA